MNANRVISIVTPVHQPSLPYLSEAYRSLTEQKLPVGWSWEWAVQFDGVALEDVGEISNVARRDSRLSLGTNRASGPAVARTTALSRTSGKLIRNLDADDLLLAGALRRDIEAFVENPSIGWATSKALDLNADGSRSGWEFSDPIQGEVPIGWVLDYWQKSDWRLPILPGTLCIRRDLLLALGGWMSLPTSEDTGLLIAANMLTVGFFNGEPSMLYRKHDKQTTKQGHHVDGEDLRARRAVIVERAESIKSLSFQFPAL